MTQVISRPSGPFENGRVNLGCLTLAALLLYPLVVLPFQEAALLRLGVHPLWVTTLALSMLVGGLLHLPVWSREREELVVVPAPGPLGWLRRSVRVAPRR